MARELSRRPGRELSRRQLLIGGSATIALAGLPGCAGSLAAESGGEGSVVRTTAANKNPVFAQSVQITSLDTAGGQPQVYPAGYEAAFAVYSGLVRFTPEQTVEADLATGWTVDDEQTWTFELRTGVRFHDETPFDADAVVSYFTAMLDDTYNLGAYTLWQPIERVVKVDDHTVRIVTTEPYGALLNTMAHASALVPSPAALQKFGADAGLNPVGTGPYRVREFAPGSRLVVEANEAYYGPAPRYESISYIYVADAFGRVAALRSGQADIIDAVPVEQAKGLDGPGGMGLVNVPGLQVFGIGLNQNHPALRERRIRQAMNHAIDVDAIVSALFRDYATVLDSPLATKTDGYAACGEYTYDVETAQAMLQEAGCEMSDDGTLTLDGEPIVLRLRTPDGMYPADVRVAQVVQEQLGSVGIDVTIQKVDKSTFWDGISVAREDVDFDLVLFGYNPSHGSGALQLDALYLSNESPDDPPRQWNFNWYSNSEVDELIGSSARMVDPEEQAATLATAQQMIWEDAPYIWLYAKNNLTAYNSEVATPVVLPLSFTLPSAGGDADA